MIISDTKKIKKMNVELIKSTIKDMGPLTKLSVSNITGLSVATCNTILNELLANNEISETANQMESRSGRPAKYFKYNSDHAHIACIMLQKDGPIQSLSYVIANLLGEILDENHISLNTLTLEHLFQSITTILEKDSLVNSIGIGIPGVVDDGYIEICDIPSLIHVNLKDELNKQFDVDFTIDNDMNYTVQGVSDHTMNGNDLAVLTFLNNELPGAGFLVNGQVINGSSYFAGEISYLPFGLAKDQLVDQMQTKEGFINLCSRIISVVTTIINPKYVILTGKATNPAFIPDIEKACLQYIPAKHMPQITCKKDLHTEYIKGLIQATLKKRHYPFRISTEN